MHGLRPRTLRGDVGGPVDPDGGSRAGASVLVPAGFEPVTAGLVVGHQGGATAQPDADHPEVQGHTGVVGHRDPVAVTVVQPLAHRAQHPPVAAPGRMLGLEPDLRAGVQTAGALRVAKASYAFAPGQLLQQGGQPGRIGVCGTGGFRKGCPSAFSTSHVPVP